MFASAFERFIDSMPFGKFVQISNDNDDLLPHTTNLFYLFNITVIERPNLLL